MTDLYDIQSGEMLAQGACCGARHAENSLGFCTNCPEVSVNEQEQFWSGSFGDEYTKRNRVDWRARIPFWADIMKFTGARSVYEVGCNAGWNLSAIREASPHETFVYGCDINSDAVYMAWKAGHDQVQIGSAKEHIGLEYEMVVTSGLLIHVATAELQALMRLIAECSSRYVLAIEYAADAEEMIEYRGERDRLWKRPYGKLYEEMGLKILHTGEATGWENTQYWLMEKP